MKFPDILPICLLLAGCETATSGSADELPAATRNSIDFILDRPDRKRGRESRLDPESKRACALEKSADLVVEFTFDGELDIGVGSSRDGARYPQHFSFGELVGFFDEQRHKQLIVVNVHKGAPGEDSIQEAIDRINRYFKDRGYRRVVICQFRGWGRPIHSDTRFRS